MVCNKTRTVEYALPDFISHSTITLSEIRYSYSAQISFSNQRDIHFQMPSWCQDSESVHQSKYYVSQSKPETISILSQRSLHK